VIRLFKRTSVKTVKENRDYFNRDLISRSFTVHVNNQHLSHVLSFLCPYASKLYGSGCLFICQMKYFTPSIGILYKNVKSRDLKWEGFKKKNYFWPDSYLKAVYTSSVTCIYQFTGWLSWCRPLGSTLDNCHLLNYKIFKFIDNTLSGEKWRR
jgi:hypothetical protein